MRFKRALGVFIFMVFCFGNPAVAGTASGRFTAGKAAISPKYADAYVVRDQFDGRKSEVEVVLSELPFDAKEAATELDPHGFAINADALKQGNYILLWVKPDGGVSMNATFSQSMSQYGDDTRRGLKATLTLNTPEKIEGRVFTPKPVKTMSGETYKIDVKFSTAVASTKGGSNLPADGGEPLKALKGLYRAIAKKDLKAIKSGMTAENVSQLMSDNKNDEENLKSVTDILEIWLPKKMKFLSGTISDDRAILELQGEPYEGTKMVYLVRMAKTGARWTFDRAVPAGFMK